MKFGFRLKKQIKKLQQLAQENYFRRIQVIYFLYLKIIIINQKIFLVSINQIFLTIDQ
ncbi:hypothetical protein pb186bvf_011661 [Paramecium bursaria]